MPAIKSQQKTTFSKDAFKKAGQKKIVAKKQLPTPTPQPTDDTVTQASSVKGGAPAPASFLSTILEAQDPDAFVIQPPDKKSKLYMESKIYFFETSTMIKIKISSNDITYDVIRHIMTLYK